MNSQQKKKLYFLGCYLVEKCSSKEPKKRVMDWFKDDKKMG